MKKRIVVTIDVIPQNKSITESKPDDQELLRCALCKKMFPVYNWETLGAPDNKAIEIQYEGHLFNVHDKCLTAKIVASRMLNGTQ